MKKALIASCLVAAALVRCPATAAAPTTTTATKPTVALVLKTLNHPFFVDMRRGAQEAADRLGVTLQVQAAEREIDVEKQMQIVENMIQTGIQALCITPSGSREIVSALVKAKDAKVPIIVVDTRVDAKAAADAGVRTETFVGSDNYEGGKLAGEYLVKVDRRQGARRHPRGHSRPRDRRLAPARLPRRGQGRRRASRSSRRSRRTGSATRASTCSRTCCRRTPTSTACSPAAT